jgi:hypothetical protein
MTQDQKQAKDSARKSVGTVQNESDPRSELGLKSPVEKSEGRSERRGRQEAEGQKATQFDGNPNPQEVPSSALKPEDDTPMTLAKESRNDQ